MALPGKRWPLELFDHSGRRFLRYLAARLRDGTDADDLAQEAYLRLLRMDENMIMRNPRSFALRVAANVATDWGRLSRHRKEHVGAELLEDQDSEYSDPFEQTLRDQQFKSAQTALDAMTPIRRAVMLLYLRDNLTYAQIAAEVGLSVGMVNKHLSAGLQACRDSLTQRRQEARS